MTEKPAENGPRKVALIGKAANTQKDAPFDDSTWEIWTLYDMVQRGEVPRTDRHFELHRLDKFRDQEPEYYQWLKLDHGMPLYLREEVTDIPHGIAYPVADVTDRFGRYFTNTVSWMIAMAIDEKVDEIGLWGVDMAADTEYGSQRPSCEYFLGLAVGQGIKVSIAKGSMLLRNNELYGFETDSGEQRQIIRGKRGEVASLLGRLREDRNQAALNAAACEGALQILDFWQRSL